MKENEAYIKNEFQNFNSYQQNPYYTNTLYSLGIGNNYFPVSFPNYSQSIDMGKVIDLMASNKAMFQIALMKQNQLTKLHINDAGEVTILFSKIFTIQKEDSSKMIKQNIDLIPKKSIRNSPLRIRQAILLILHYKNECERLRAMKIKKFSEGACMTLNVSKKTINDYQMYLRIGIHFNKLTETDFNTSFGKYRKEMKKFKMCSNEKWDKAKDKDIEEVFGYLLSEEKGPLI